MVESILLMSLALTVKKIIQKFSSIRNKKKTLLSCERSELLASIKEGQVMTGIVKHVTNYGALIDLGRVNGLVDITMTWQPLKQPGNTVIVGEPIQVRVLKFDQERNRISLSLIH